MSSSNDVKITEDVFGVLPADSETGEKEQSIKRFTLTNGNGMKVQIINYGATITSIQVPIPGGAVRDVVLGYEDFKGYLGAYGRNPYFGATIGRVANRTGKSKFILNGKEYNLTVNNGENHLHGGTRGFDKRVWESHLEDGKITFSYLSPDGEQGYPGDLLANVTFELTPNNALLINYQATTTKPTPVCLTNHSYFNLAGHENADKMLDGHTIQLESNSYTLLDEGLIVTGEVKDVQGTLYDLRTPKDLKELLGKFPPGANGYDINFCINKTPTKSEELNLVGRMTHKSSTVTMELEVRSDQPGLQFYSSNFLPDPANNESPIPGKNNAKYLKHGACCLETQNYPNAINTPQFPNAVLNPGAIYSHSTSFQFRVYE